jgi:hypothetical protein
MITLTVRPRNIQTAKLVSSACSHQIKPMHALAFLILLSLSSNDSSDNGILYRQLTWSDYKSPPPLTEPLVAARTMTQLKMETVEQDGVYCYSVKAYFLPYFSFARVKTNDVLRHEQTHFKIAHLLALECMRDLHALQHGDSTAASRAENVFNSYVERNDSTNDRFDLETDHSLIKEAEKSWEFRITEELTNIQKSSAPANNVNRKNTKGI